MSAICAEVLSAFHNLWFTWAKRKNGRDTIHNVTPLFHPDLTSFGSGSHEMGRNIEQAISNFQADFDEYQQPFELDFTYEKSHELAEDIGFVEAEAVLTLTMKDSE